MINGWIHAMDNEALTVLLFICLISFLIASLQLESFKIRIKKLEGKNAENEKETGISPPEGVEFDRESMAVKFREKTGEPICNICGKTDLLLMPGFTTLMFDTHLNCARTDVCLPLIMSLCENCGHLNLYSTSKYDLKAKSLKKGE